MLQGTVKLLYHRFTYYNVFTHKHNLVLIHSISAQAVVCFAKLHTSFKILSVKLFSSGEVALVRGKTLHHVEKSNQFHFVFWWPIHGESSSASALNPQVTPPMMKTLRLVSTMVRTHYKQESHVQACPQWYAHITNRRGHVNVSTPPPTLHPASTPTYPTPSTAARVAASVYREQNFKHCEQKTFSTVKKNNSTPDGDTCWCYTVVAR